MFLIFKKIRQPRKKRYENRLRPYVQSLKAQIEGLNPSGLGLPYSPLPDKKIFREISIGIDLDPGAGLGMPERRIENDRLRIENGRKEAKG